MFNSAFFLASLICTLKDCIKKGGALGLRSEHMDDVPGGKLRGMRFQQNLFYIMDLSLAIYQVQISALTVLSLLAKL